MGSLLQFAVFQRPPFVERLPKAAFGALPMAIRFVSISDLTLPKKMAPNNSVGAIVDLENVKPVV